MALLLLKSSDSFACRQWLGMQQFALPGPLCRTAEVVSLCRVAGTEAMPARDSLHMWRGRTCNRNSRAAPAKPLLVCRWWFPCGEWLSVQQGLERLIPTQLQEPQKAPKAEVSHAMPFWQGVRLCLCQPCLVLTAADTVGCTQLLWCKAAAPTLWGGAKPRKAPPLDQLR